MLQINTDITEHKRAAEDLRKSEERWRAVFESSSVGIALTDLHGNFQEVNGAYQKMLGYSSEELRALSSREITYEDDGEARWNSLTDLREGKRQYFDIEKRYRRKDGNLVWGNVHVSLVPGKGGIPLFLMAVTEDITERTEAAEALQSARAQLAHMGRVTLLGELAASIAHEVNQPLTAVVTNGNACLRWLNGSTPNLDEARDAVTRAVREGNRANDVIRRIRSLVKKSPMQMEPLNINELLQEVLVLTRHEILKNGVSLRTEFADDIPFVTGDRVQLQQVILNLIMNAVEATSTMSEDSRDLVVASLKKGPNQVVIAVRDSGVGIDPQNRDRLFEAFFTTEPAGMGVGLSISRSLIEVHGGRLWATPNEGHGATFQFSLPAAGAV